MINGRGKTVLAEPGNWLIYTYTYQTVDGVELPEHVAVIRESHREVWQTD